MFIMAIPSPITVIIRAIVPIVHGVAPVPVIMIISIGAVIAVIGVRTHNA
ncbi:MAG TPA: hypothetical protein VGJ94_06560 [Syntrophorhabdaceae bacterium]|jgi:hypothetical protein